MKTLHYVFENEIDKVIIVGTEITKAFLDRCDEKSINEFFNVVNERGRTALHNTSNKGDVDSCKLLIEKGASVIALDKKGMNALHYAFKGGNDKVLDVATNISQALVDRCDKQRICEFVNTIDLKRGRITLHSASEKGSMLIYELIIDNGDLVNIKDKTGMTALHYAFQEGNGKDIDVMIEIAKLLLHSCDKKSMHSFVNATDKEGRIALHYASDIGIAPMCELFLEHGALITLQDEKGMTPLHYAFEGGIDKVEDVGINIAQALLHKCHEQRIYEFFDATYEEGRTALHCASDNGNTPMCELLVKCVVLMTI